LHKTARCQILTAQTDKKQIDFTGYTHIDLLSATIEKVYI